MKRILSVILILCFCIQLMPLNVFAAAGDHALKLELVKDTTTFAGKEVLRVDLMYKSGSDPVTDQMVNLRYDATKLTPLMIDGNDGSAYATNFSTDWASLYTMNNYATPGPIPAVTTPSEVVFYTTIQNNVGYICWKVTEKGTPPAFADFTRVSSIFFELKEGVSFTAFPDNALTFSNLAEDSAVTNQVTTVAITSSSTSYVWGATTGEDTLTVEPVVLGGEGVTIVSSAPAPVPTIDSVSTDLPNAFTGKTPKLSVTATGSDGLTLNYQWQQKNGSDWTDIPGATAAEYTLPALTEAGTFEYRALVWNTKDGSASSEKVASETVTINVDAAVELASVEIAMSPSPTVGSEVTLGVNYTFASEHAYSANLCNRAYQWYRYDGSQSVAINGATSQNYVFTPTTAGEFKYYVEMTHTQRHSKDTDVTNVSEMRSPDEVVTISALPAPTITTDLSTTPVEYFTTTDEIAPLTIVATQPEGVDGTLTYQWQMNTGTAESPNWVDIEGATGVSYNPSANRITCAYKVKVTFTSGDAASSVESAVATVVFVEPAAKPTITNEPVGATYWQGDNAAALAPVIGDPDDGTLTYQWYSNTVESNTNGTLIEGATSATYTPSTETVGTTYYYLVVTNTKTIAGGVNSAETATSDPVAVTVVAKAQMPTVTVTVDKKVAVLGETVTLTADANVTDGGTLTYQWYDENGVAIPNEIDSTFNVTSSVEATHKYHVKVTNTKTYEGLDNSTATANSANFMVSFVVDAAFAEAQNALAAIAPIDAKFLDDKDDILVKVKPLVTAAMTSITGVTATVQDSTAALAGDTFTVTVNLNNGHTNVDYTLSVQVNRAANPSIKLVDDTLVLLDASDFAAIAQDASTSETTVLNAALAKAQTAMSVDTGVTINKVSYTAPVAGTYANANGVNGELVFTVSYTATAAEGTEHTGTSSQFTLTITADPLTAQERVEAAMAELNTIVQGVTLAQTTATDYIDQSAVLDAVYTQLNAALEQYGVMASVMIPAGASNVFTAPAAGSAATTRTGTNGSIKYNVTLSDKSNGTVSQTTTTPYTTTIAALPFVGLLDREAVTAAETTLAGLHNGNLSIPFGSTDDQIKTAAEQAISTALDALKVTTVDGEYPAGVTYTFGAPVYAKNGDKVTTIMLPVTVSKASAQSANNPINVLLNVTEGKNPSETLSEKAMAALTGIAFADVALKDYPDQAAVEAKIKADVEAKIAADTTIDMSKITVAVSASAYQAAANGTSAEPTAKHGSIAFEVSVTATDSVLPVTKKIENQSFAIKAKDFDGVSDADAVKYTKEAVETLITLGKIDQNKAETAEAAKAALLAELKTAVEAKAGNKTVDWNALTLTVDVSEFTAAVAGSAATTKEGTNGSFKLSVSAAQGGQSYATSAAANITITATPFNGVLDTEAVAAAKAALTGTTAIVPIRATETELLNTVQTFVNTKLTGNAAGVVATLTKEGTNSFKVTLTKAGASDTVTVNWKEADPIKLAAPANVVFEQGVAEWDAVDHAVSYVVTLYSSATAGNEKLAEFLTTDMLYDLSAELQKGQSYVVTVKAIADGVFYVNSDESMASEAYSIKNDSMYDNLWFWVLLKQYSQVYPISATAGEGGTISPAGRSEVQYKRNLTYTITPDEGYAIEAVWVDGENLGAIDTYTFKQVKGAHTIKVDFVKLGWDGPFTDVEPLADYAEAIRFVYENGYVDGVSETEFAPETAMTRADLVTALGKMIGVDTTYYMNSSYTDVAADAEYAPYVAWAVDAKIMLGKEDGSFGVNDSMTIEQVAFVLEKFATYAGLSTKSDSSLEGYTDTAAIAESALAAMKWIVGSGIYAGENGALTPQAAASRALIADMLYHFSVLVD